MSIFEQASRTKFRFKTDRGVLAIEDLWDLPLGDLDDMAVSLHKHVTDNQTRSFIKEKKEDKTLKMRFDIVKHILDVKLEEKENKTKAAVTKLQRKKLMQAIAAQEDKVLSEASVDDLKKQLKELGEEV